MLVNKPHMYSIVDTHTRHVYLSVFFAQKRGADSNCSQIFSPGIVITCCLQFTIDACRKNTAPAAFFAPASCLEQRAFWSDMVLEGSQYATPISATRLVGLECRSILTGVRIYMVKLLRRNHQHIPRQKKNTTSLTHRHLHVFEILPSYPYPGPPASKEWQPPWWLPSRSSYLLDESCTHQPARRKGEELLDRSKCRGTGQVRIFQKLQCYKACYRRFKLICMVIEQLNAMHLDP